MVLVCFVFFFFFQESSSWMGICGHPDVVAVHCMDGSNSLPRTAEGTRAWISSSFPWAGVVGSWVWSFMCSFPPILDMFLYEDPR